MRSAGLVLLLVLSACYNPNIQSGAQQCAPGGKCPDGFTCGPDNKCYQGQPPKLDMSTAGVDGGARDLAVDFAVAGDLAMGCTGDTECASTPQTPRCDTSTGLCVACLSMNDNCPQGSYCDDATHTCKQGCTIDSDCTMGAVPRCCNHVCVDITADANNCGACAKSCNGGSCCASMCADTTMDPNNCGACGMVCTGGNASWQCMASKCGVASCTAPYADCDTSPTNGCETNTSTDPNNCTKCGMQCTVANGTAGCASGCTIASCTAPYKDCNGQYSDGCEANTATDPNNCGTCGKSCPNTTNATSTKCSSSACAVATCTAGYADCDGSYANGCEVNVNTDVNNCGTCGKVCPMGTGCNSGGCQAGVFAFGQWRPALKCENFVNNGSNVQQWCFMLSGQTMCMGAWSNIGTCTDNSNGNGIEIVADYAATWPLRFNNNQNLCLNYNPMYIQNLAYALGYAKYTVNQTKTGNSCDLAWVDNNGNYATVAGSGNVNLAEIYDVTFFN